MILNEYFEVLNFDAFFVHESDMVACVGMQGA